MESVLAMNEQHRGIFFLSIQRQTHEWLKLDKMNVVNLSVLNGIE